MDKYPKPESYVRQYPGEGSLEETAVVASTDAILTTLNQTIGLLYEATSKLESRITSVLSAGVEQTEPMRGETAESYKVNQRLIKSLKALDELKTRIDMISARVEL